MSQLSGQQSACLAATTNIQKVPLLEQQITVNVSEEGKIITETIRMKTNANTNEMKAK